VAHFVVDHSTSLVVTLFDSLYTTF